MTRFFCRPVGMLLGTLLLGGGVLLGSCDDAGSKRESLYQRLASEERWTIERLDGPLIDPSRLDQRYAEVRMTFRTGDGGRRYRIVGQYSPDSTEVLAEGAVGLPGSNVLRMASGFPRLVTWTYEFEASRAVFELRIGARSFLGTLFPGTTWNESQDLEMTLAPAGE